MVRKSSQEGKGGPFAGWLKKVVKRARGDPWGFPLFRVGQATLVVGAASTVHIIGLPLVHWAGKPQGKHSGLRSLTNTNSVSSVGYSYDGKLLVTGSADNLVKIWNAVTGAEVSVFNRVC